MRRTLNACSLALCLIGPATARAAGDGTPLASAMIDGSMFRDGEVVRSTEVHGAWTLVCDAIVRLKRRFCSMKSAPVVIGAARVELTVSTGDDGQPAALVRLPFGLALAPGLVVSGEPAQHMKARRVPIALCDGAGCEAAWSLSGPELDALRNGRGLRLALQGWTAARLTGGGTVPPPMVATFTGAGFPDALAASLR